MVGDNHESANITPARAELTYEEMRSQLETLQKSLGEMEQLRRDQTPTGADVAAAELQTQRQQMEAHAKALQENTQRLQQLELENETLREANSALTANQTTNHRFRVPVPRMPTLETPRTNNLGERGNPAATGTQEDQNLAQGQEDLMDTEEPRATGLTPLSDEARRLEQMFSSKFEALQSVIERLLGFSPPLRKSALSSYADTPFSEEIALTDMPKKFTFPFMKLYDGTSDPDNHIAQYKQKMLTVAIQREQKEAVMCKGFGSSLTGAALQWFISIPTGTIGSFAHLTDMFVEQFASSRVTPKSSDDLYEIRQRKAEPLRSYLHRFNNQKVMIPDCSVTTAISAFKRGLLPDGDLYKELTKHRCRTMEEVLSRAQAQIKWEEDLLARQESRVMRTEKIARDDKPYQRPIRDDGQKGAKGHKPLGKPDVNRYPPVHTWPDVSNLSISSAELVGVLKEMGGQVKWPQKMRSPDNRRNPNKWCDFHNDHGNRTEDCISLRIEVNELLKKGHLREFLSNKAKEMLDNQEEGVPAGRQAPDSPRHDRVINVISGGSEISGITHAAAKKSTRLAKNNHSTPEVKRQNLSQEVISFTAGGQDGVLAPHHDALVVSLSVANCLVKRVLIDNGSSTNVLFLGAYTDLGLTQEALIKKTTPLVGFSG